MFPTARVCQSLRLKQISLSLAELHFCLLSVLDIRKQDIPVKDAAFHVPAWEAAYLEPSICSVGSADAVLNLVRISRFHRALPQGAHECEIIRMYKRVPVLQFLQSLARIVQDALIDV